MKINRSFYIRVAVILVVILIGVWMFFIGKQHTILLDNNRAGDVRFLDEVIVSVDGAPGLEIYSRMRDQAIVTGQKHSIQVTYPGDDGNYYTFTKTINIPLNENMMILSLPLLVLDPNSPQETWLTHFESQAVTVDDSADANEVDLSDDLLDF